MHRRVTSRQVYVFFALVMVIIMAVGGSGLLEAPSGPSSSQGQAATAAPPDNAAQVPLGATYQHPSGYFEITPPLGWLFEEKTEGTVASASWVGSAQGAVLHAFTIQSGEPVTREQLIRQVESEFPGGFKNYTAYTVTRQNYDSDPITVDFALSLGDRNFVSREWAGAEENLVWVLRAVAPDNNPGLLTYFEENILPTYRVFADALPVPVDWEVYTNPERAYTFRHPAAWADHGTGQDGARRFVDAQAGWQVEMAVLVQPETSVRTGERARAWLEAMEPEAEVSSVVTATRRHGDGYLVSFEYPAGQGRRRGLLLLLNANGAVYRVDLRLPPGADDPLNDEAQRRAQQAIQVLDTFSPLPASGPIPSPVLGG